MITIAATGRPRHPDYPLERVLPGAIAGLLRHDDWGELTAHLNSSPRHVKNLQRWIDIVRAKNPRLNDDQAERIAALMRTAYFRRLARLSVIARARARAQARAETDPGT